MPERAYVDRCLNGVVTRRSRGRSGLLLAGAFTLAFHACGTGALAAQKEVEKVKQFGDWSMYCENDNAPNGRCALVQAVSGAAGSDPRAWVKASIETDASGAMTFKFRVDRSVRLAPGVGVRIDQRQVGIAVPFRCEETFCEASLNISDPLQPNEFGVNLLTGKTMEFDVFFDDGEAADGYRIPLNLSGVREGVAELASRFHQEELVAMAYKDNVKKQSKDDHIGGLKTFNYTWDFLLDDKEKSNLSLRIEPTIWTPMIASDDSIYIKPWKTMGDLNLQRKYTQRCILDEPSGQNKVLAADVKIGSELKLADEYQNKIKQLVNESKNCGATNFFVITIDNGDAGKGPKLNDFERTAKTLSLANALQDEGISKDRIVTTSEDGKTLKYLPFAMDVQSPFVGTPQKPQ